MAVSASISTADRPQRQGIAALQPHHQHTLTQLQGDVDTLLAQLQRQLSAQQPPSTASTVSPVSTAPGQAEAGSSPNPLP